MVVISYKTVKEFTEKHPNAKMLLITGLPSRRSQTGQTSMKLKRCLVLLMR